MRLTEYSYVHLSMSIVVVRSCHCRGTKKVWQKASRLFAGVVLHIYIRRYTHIYIQHSQAIWHYSCWLKWNKDLL